MGNSRIFCLLALFVYLLLPAPCGAQPPPPLLFASPVSEITICNDNGERLPVPPLLFEAPAEEPQPEAACGAAAWRLQTEQQFLPEQPRFWALSRAGGLRPVRVAGVLARGETRRLIAEPLPCEGCADAPLLALLPHLPPEGVADRLGEGGPSGNIRRLTGRKSLLARGRLWRGEPAWAAVFQVAGEAAQLALFSERGALLLHRSVPWQAERSAGRRARVKPRALLRVPQLAGPGSDGLLLLGEGGAALLLTFERGELRVRRQ